MGILAWLAEQLLGPGLKVLLVPALALGLVTAWHQGTKAKADAAALREAQALARGRSECIAEVRLKQAEAALAAEKETSRRSRDEVEAANKVTREVQDNAERIEKQLREEIGAARGGDDRCLSDGMLDLVRKQGGVGQGARSPGGGSGRGAGGSAGKAP